MQIYFVWHGESEANVLRVISNRQLPHGLTEKGRQQAETVANALKLVSISAMYSSPVLRAVQTAEILSRTLGVRYEITDALREYDCGILEGRADEDAWAQHAAVFEKWITGRDRDYRADQGESFNDIKARFVPFIDQLLDAHRYTDRNIVLVGHGGIFHAMLPQILMNISVDFAMQHPLRRTSCVVAESAPLGLICREWAGEKLSL